MHFRAYAVSGSTTSSTWFCSHLHDLESVMYLYEDLVSGGISWGVKASQMDIEGMLIKRARAIEMRCQVDEVLSLFRDKFLKALAERRDTLGNMHDVSDELYSIWK